jgi:transcriptional regulator with XRE-family HTH domain
MTTLTFRNVSASPDDPVEQWPQEAIQAALERGSLSHWQRLAEAIRAEPWGPVARRVEEVLTYSRPYGVANAMERIVARAREAAEANERQAVAAEVARLIDESGLTRAEFASRIGTSTSRLSTYATGKVTPSAGLLLRTRRVALPARAAITPPVAPRRRQSEIAPDPHDVELAKSLLDMTPAERLRALRRFARLHASVRGGTG